MDYELHGQGLTMRAGNYPALTVMNHFMMRKDMKHPTIPVSYGLSVEQRALHRSGARPPNRRSRTGGYYKRRSYSGHRKHHRSGRRRR